MRTVSLLAGLAACAPRGGPAPEGEDPLQVLIDRVLVPSGLGEDEVVVHEVGHLPAGARLGEAYAGEDAALTEATTLFLVDQQAYALWSHDVSWVFVDDDGDLREEAHAMFPVVDGAPWFPAEHPAAWGAPWEVVDPAALGEDALPDWSAALRAAPAAADPCARPGGRAAITVAGGYFPAAMTDEKNWRKWLAQQGRQVTRVRPSSGATVGADDVQTAIAGLGALGHLEELVVVYSGHGLEDGSLAFGTGADGTADEVLGLRDLAAMLAGVDADRLVIILGSCFSGVLANELPAELKADGMLRTDIVVKAATTASEPAWIEQDLPGSAFLRRMWQQAAATPAGEPVDWAGLQVAPFTAATRVGQKAQSPTSASQPRCVPRIALSAHPDDGACLATWIDAQAYDREVYLFGEGFGEGTGRVELQQEDGDWVVVPHSRWSPTAITLHLPMRRDGFPANGTAPALPTVEPPGATAAAPGRYAVRVVSAEDFASDPAPVELEYQVYEQKWTPEVVDGDFPDWVELWHPFTEEALWTLGPTVQLSYLWNPGVDPTALTLAGGAWTALDGTLDAPTLAGAGLPGPWEYDLLPGLRNLATAYDQSEPEVRYFGLRIGFPSDDVAPTPWTYTLIYD